MLNELAFDGSHLLVVGFESTDHPVDDDLERALEIATGHGGRCPDGVEDRTEGGGAEDCEDTDEGSWRDSFFEGPYLFNALGSMGVLVDTFETAVIWERFPELHEALQSNVVGAMHDECGAGFLASRFTHVYEDGPAPYYTLVAPAEVGRELEQWRAIKRAASDMLLDPGATIAHHHAVGRSHREHYHREAPDATSRHCGR